MSSIIHLHAFYMKYIYMLSTVALCNSTEIFVTFVYNDCTYNTVPEVLAHKQDLVFEQF